MDDNDMVILTGSDDTMASTQPYSYSTTSGVGFDSITIDTSGWSNAYSITTANPTPNVSIDTTGITMLPESDLRIGDRSLKDFMDRVEERLNILRPNPKLEDKWNELADLGKRYRELEAEILEKEKMWNILKDEG